MKHPWRPESKRGGGGAFPLFFISRPGHRRHAESLFHPRASPARSVWCFAPATDAGPASMTWPARLHAASIRLRRHGSLPFGLLGCWGQRPVDGPANRVAGCHQPLISHVPLNQWEPATAPPCKGIAEAGSASTVPPVLGSTWRLGSGHDKSNSMGAPITGRWGPMCLGSKGSKKAGIWHGGREKRLPLVAENGEARLLRPLGLAGAMRLVLKAKKSSIRLCTRMLLYHPKRCK